MAFDFKIPHYLAVKYKSVELETPFTLKDKNSERSEYHPLLSRALLLNGKFQQDRQAVKAQDTIFERDARTGAKSWNMPIIWSTESAWSFIYWFFFFQFESAIDSYLTISVQIKIHCVITTVLMYFHSSVLRLPQVSKNRLLERMNLLFRHHCTLKENLFNSSGNNCKYSGNNIRKNKPWTSHQMTIILCFRLQIQGSVPASSEILEMEWKQLQRMPDITFFQFPGVLLGDWKSILFKKQNLIL